MKRILALIFMLLILAMACSWADTMVNPAAEPVNTPITTSSVTPTQNHLPTQTTEPSSTIQPTPTNYCPPHPGSASSVAAVQERTETLIPDAKVVWYDDFICQDFSYGWWSPNTNPKTLISIDNGILGIQAERADNITASIIRNAHDIGDTAGILVLFRYRKGSSITLFIDSGEWLESSYRGWGLAENGDNLGHNFWFRWNGKYLTNSDFPTNILKPDIWYYLLIRLGEKGDVTMQVMQKEHQTISATYHLVLGEVWAHKDWKAVFQVPKGTLEVDEYWQILFTRPA